MIARREPRPTRGARGRGSARAIIELDRPRVIRNLPDGKSAPRASAGATIAWLSLALLLVACCAALTFTFRSDRFRLSHVEVRGASQPVVQQIAASLSSGCHLQTSRQAGVQDISCQASDHLRPNLFLLNTANLSQQIARLPAVKTASVRATLPDRLYVTIAERLPEAAWVVGPDVFRVAADGRVIDQGSAEGLRVVVGAIDGPPIKPGDTVDVNVLQGAEELQQRLPAEFGVPIERINYSQADGLAVIGDQNMIAMFGAPNNLGLKMAELQRIVQLAKDKKTPLAFVDLRYKTPYYRAR